MLFNSIDYLIFYPVVLLVYFLMPRRISYLWLLAASFYFYACWNAVYALLMLTSIAITYASGLLIDHFRARQGMRKLCVALSFGLNLAILVYFKYGNFIVENVNALLAAIGVSQRAGHLSVLLPVGISFYTFQALSYTMDVYRGEIGAEKNFFRYALFVSFFPQLVAGPIERSKNLLTQLREPKPFDVRKARRGLLLMAWGLFLKIVLADNIAQVIDPVFDAYQRHAGSEIALATCLFAFQIHCDFAGYSLIAIGSANVLGYDLMRNFDCPYLAPSVGDFWRRWHISLSTWFRDYLYIPLGGNRRGTARKYINTMIVFLVSGLWHGASWTYVIWGGLNGAMLVLGEATAPLRLRATERLGINRARLSYRLWQRVATFALICFTWLFFRARSVGMAWEMIVAIATDFRAHLLLSPALFPLAAGAQQAAVLLLSLLALGAVDGLRYGGADVAAGVQAQGAWLRWGVYCALVLAIIVFGIYGNFYGQTQFLYFQF